MYTVSLAVSLFLAMSPQHVSSTPLPDRDAVVAHTHTEQPSTSASVPAPRPKRRKPELKLNCTPPISNAVYEDGRVRSRVACSVRVLNPNERFWCPAVEWSIGSDESPSSHESDCDPYERVVAEEGEPGYWAEDQPKEFGLPPGRYQIWVSLKKSGKVIARDYFIVQVN